MLQDTTAVSARWQHRYRLWTLRRENRSLGAEAVRVSGQWQLRLFAQGILFLWHPCQRLDIALEFAETIRDDLARERWR